MSDSKDSEVLDEEELSEEGDRSASPPETASFATPPVIPSLQPEARRASSKGVAPEAGDRTELEEGELRLSEPVDSRASRVGSLIAERYRVGRVLGEGSMGTVYEAEHIHMKKRVALKVLNRNMSTNSEVVARFEREAVAAGRLEHPGVVAATDFGRLVDDSFYLVLEFVDGKALSEALEEVVVFPPSRALGIAFQIVSVLHVAHGAGIVHRDMKPENVMLVKTSDPGDFVKVLDFGIAKMRIDEEEPEGLTQAGLVFGTPEYMSPEQAKGHEADERSDIYGVGMLLFEMLTGESPFHAEDVTAMLVAQITEPAPPLSDDIPEPLRKLVASLLEKDPGLRPQSTADLVSELTKVAKAEGWSLPTPRTKSGTLLDRQGGPVEIRTLQERPSLAASALHSVQSFTGRPVAIGSKKIPLWVPLVALLGGLAGGGLLIVQERGALVLSGSTNETALVDEESQLLVEARSGDRDAVSELRKLTALKQSELEQSEGEARERDAVSRQANRYLVLGRGYSVIKHYSAALSMYREAVGLDPHLSEDSELLLDVRVALGARDAVEEGLDFALSELGAHGADLIFDVYLDHLGQAGKTPVVARAMKLVKSTELLKHATLELKVALRLENAKLCGEYRDIIPDALKYADDRSVHKLRPLTSRRGCGSLSNKDCYQCLRKEGIPLDEALLRAKSHPSPNFLTPTERKKEGK